MSGKIISKLNTVQRQDTRDREKEFTVNNASTLLLEAPKESLEMLHKTGLTHTIDLAKQAKAKVDAYNYFKKTIGNNYTGEMVEKLCKTYDLKICKADHFKGLINPTELGAVINDFVKTHNVEMKYNSFYILAPAEYFRGTSKISSNCVLFYKETNDHISNISLDDRLIEIYSWGPSMSELRVLRTLIAKDYNPNDDNLSTIGYTIIATLLLILGFFSMLFFIPVGMVLTGIGLFMLFANGVTDKKFEEKWNEKE